MPRADQAPSEVKKQWCEKGLKNVRERVVQVDPDKIRFGIEIECLLPYAWLEANDVEVGDYHNGEEIGNGFPEEWEIQRDGSLTSNTSRLRPVEITSPVLQGQEGIEEVRKVCKLLTEIGAQVNNSCGIHVHVDMPSVLGRQPSAKLQASWVNRIVALVSNLEYGLYLITGNPSRANNYYCQSIKGPWAEMNSYKDYSEASRYSYAARRYRVVNFTNLFEMNKPTVEFRVFSATLNYKKVTSFIHAALAIAHRAARIGRAMKFDPTPTRQLYRPDTEVVAEVERFSKILKDYGFSRATAKLYAKEVNENRVWNARKFSNTPPSTTEPQATPEHRNDIPF